MWELGIILPIHKTVSKMEKLQKTPHEPMTKIEVTGQMILPKWTVTEVFRKQWGLNICLPGACACALTPYKHIKQTNYSNI